MYLHCTLVRVSVLGVQVSDPTVMLLAGIVVSVARVPPMSAALWELPDTTVPFTIWTALLATVYVVVVA